MSTSSGKEAASVADESGSVKYTKTYTTGLPHGKKRQNDVPPNISQANASLRSIIPGLRFASTIGQERSIQIGPNSSSTNATKGQDSHIKPEIQPSTTLTHLPAFDSHKQKVTPKHTKLTAFHIASSSEVLARLQQALIASHTPQMLEPISTIDDPVTHAIEGRQVVNELEGNERPNCTASSSSHLRKPVPALLETSKQKLYSFVVGFALIPQPLHLPAPLHVFTFNIGSSAAKLIPSVMGPEEAGKPATRIIENGSLLCRMRCVTDADLRAQDHSHAYRTWRDAGCIWPMGMFIELNGQDCQPRKSPHSQQHMPFDVSQIVKPGKNTLSIAYSKMSDEEEQRIYHIGVELVSTYSAESILSQVPWQTYEDGRISVQNRFASLPDGTEIKLSLMSSQEPGSMITQPVRSKSCTHLECFDFYHLLSAQQRRHPNWPTEVNGWRCPICDADARPKELYKVTYMHNLVRTLQDMKLNAPSIMFTQWGTWYPVV